MARANIKEVMDSWNANKSFANYKKMLACVRNYKNYDIEELLPLVEEFASVCQGEYECNEIIQRPFDEDELLMPEDDEWDKLFNNIFVHIIELAKRKDEDSDSYFDEISRIIKVVDFAPTLSCLKIFARRGYIDVVNRFEDYCDDIRFCGLLAGINAAGYLFFANPHEVDEPHLAVLADAYDIYYGSKFQAELDRVLANWLEYKIDSKEINIRLFDQDNCFEQHPDLYWDEISADGKTNMLECALRIADEPQKARWLCEGYLRCTVFEDNRLPKLLLKYYIHDDPQADLSAFAECDQCSFVTKEVFKILKEECGRGNKRAFEIAKLILKRRSFRYLKFKSKRRRGILSRILKMFNRRPKGYPSARLTRQRFKKKLKKQRDFNLTKYFLIFLLILASIISLIVLLVKYWSVIYKYWGVIYWGVICNPTTIIIMAAVAVVLLIRFSFGTGVKYE